MPVFMIVSYKLASLAFPVRPGCCAANHRPMIGVTRRPGPGSGRQAAAAGAGYMHCHSKPLRNPCRY